MKRRLFIFLILAIAGVGLFSLTKKPVAYADDMRMVTIHVDESTKTIATNAETVEEVMQRTGIVLSSKDKTEPKLSEEVKGMDFTINVYRSRPITVVDGANTYTVMTAERSPRKIAEEAGFQTKQEDDFHFERSDDSFTESLGTKMVIKRARAITLDLYGVESVVRTNQLTVGEFLDDRGIVLKKGDELNVAKEARILEGMRISVATVSRSVETVEEVAKFEEEQIKDAQQPVGYRKIQTPGKDGKKLVTYEIISRNGGEPERTVTQEVITERPVTQVVIVGAKQIVNVPGNCGEWLQQAGITDPDAVWLIGKESGCNPGAVNRSSGACGIPQALPCSKLPCPLDATGAVCQLNWMERYVAGRYGSWAAARAFHARNNWY